jgi:hypothetical protein
MKNKERILFGIGLVFLAAIHFTLSTDQALQYARRDHYGRYGSSSTQNHTELRSGDFNRTRSKIAVISGFVTKDTSDNRARVASEYLPHLVNKACYCNLWGYDFIFNTTWGFPDEIRSIEDQSAQRHWLDFGTWHRVPHMMAALDAGYEWILYADVDYVFQDLSLPLESFMKDWELHGKSNVHVFVPADNADLFTFSAYAVMIKNSSFGRRLLENWLKMSHGLCPNGNFASSPGEYSWELSDQPGLWYALAQTHTDFYGSNSDEGNRYKVICNETTGLAATGRVFGPELNQYMGKVGAVKSADLSKVPDGA